MTLFTHSSGQVFLGPVRITPEMAGSLLSLFLSEGTAAGWRHDAAAAESARLLCWSLTDAAAAAHRHRTATEPSGWRDALAQACRARPDPHAPRPSVTDPTCEA